MANNIKTTRRNQVFIVQKRVRGQWQMITDAIFMHRASARECSNNLNNLNPHPGRGPHRQYRVQMLRPVEQERVVDTSTTAVAV